MFAAVAALIEEGRVKDFFNVAVEQLIAGGTPMSFTKTYGLPWTEIDGAHDLRYALTTIYPRLEAEFMSGIGLSVSQDSLVAALQS